MLLQSRIDASWLRSSRQLPGHMLLACCTDRYRVIHSPQLDKTVQTRCFRLGDPAGGHGRALSCCYPGFLQSVVFTGNS